MCAISESTEVVAKQECLSTMIEGETVILHPGAGKYYGLNEVGTYVWELLDEPRTVEEVHRAVLEEYDVEYERCRRDVEDLLIDLASKNLVIMED